MHKTIILAVVLVLAFTGALQAQSTSASLTGRITDPSKAVIVDAKVTVINVGTNVRYENTTNETGIYYVTNLPPGTYRIEVERHEFKTVMKPGVVLHVQDTIEINFEMTLGSVSESITVESGAPQVSLTPSVSTTLDRNFVGNLPLNGRSFQSLILLTPGVTVASAGMSDYGQFSVNGQRASTNYFTVDGVSANIGISDSWLQAQNGALAGSYPGTSAFGGTNNLVSVDALEEFKIQTSTTAAEFGRQPGGQVQLVTRPGSNQFHGTMFEYFRNEVLDANDWFNNANRLQKAPLRQNDFGGTFSGPVVIPGLYDGHDRTFFFFSYEGQRLRLPESGVMYVPSLRVRSAAAAALKPILNAIPQPMGAELLSSSGVPTGWAPFDYSVGEPNTMDAYSIRIDHTVSSRLTLFGRFNEAPSDITSFSGGADWTVSNGSTRTLTLGANLALTPRLNNELRFNYSRQLGWLQWIQGTYGGAIPVDTALLNNGLGGYGTVQFNFGGYSAMVAGGDYVKNYQRQINVVDNASLVKGAHQFKFGVDYRRLSPTYGVQQQQIVMFWSEAAINSATTTLGSIINYGSARPQFDNYSVYGQDTWKVTPRLTLDYGLRWELNPAPTLTEGTMPAVAVGITGNPPDVSKATLAPAGTPFYKTFYRAFAPRVGVAYQLNSTSGRETVLRGGFGVYYDLGSAGATNGFPLRAASSLGAVPFPLSAANAARPAIIVPTSLPVTSGVYSNAQDLMLPYTLQWNVSLEQSLGTQQSVSVSYVGSAARRLLTTQTVNSPPGYTTSSGPRPNPNFSSIFYTWNGPTSDYDAMQVQYKARLKRGIQALVNYTWSHAIDDVSTDIGSNVLSRGNADFDVRHNLSAAVTYDLPSPGSAPVLKHIFGNWFLDGIVHAQSGLPVNVTSTSTTIDGIVVYVRPNVVPGQPFYINDPTVPGGRRFNSAAFTTPPYDPAYPKTLREQGDFGRNVLRGLPIWQVDMGLGRSFKFTERWKLQFKGEFFNIFNHPNFGSYGTTYTSPSTFGVPGTMLRSSLSSSGFGLSSLYQMGGPRSVQLSLKLTF
jgi:outer membrane receptor protein involved in Fe transport